MIKLHIFLFLLLVKWAQKSKYHPSSSGCDDSLLDKGIYLLFDHQGINSPKAKKGSGGRYYGLSLGSHPKDNLGLLASGRSIGTLSNWADHPGLAKWSNLTSHYNDRNKIHQQLTSKCIHSWIFYCSNLPPFICFAVYFLLFKSIFQQLCVLSTAYFWLLNCSLFPQGELLKYLPTISIYNQE